jgi:hypothetical protein
LVTSASSLSTVVLKYEIYPYLSLRYVHEQIAIVSP